MEKVTGCFYCEQDQAFQEVLFKICDLKVSTVFLCRDQTLPGRCTIMYQDHYQELYELPAKGREDFIDDVCVLAETIKELFGADKINYGIYGDEVPHVHATLCPKYKGKLGWGKPFIMFPEEADKVVLTEKEYQQRMDLIRGQLKEKRGGSL